MNRATRILTCAGVMITGCNDEESAGAPVVKLDESYAVVTEMDIEYAKGLGYQNSLTTPEAVQLTLDVYSPENRADSRPVFMFIHGGGFKGGTTTNPEIVEIAEFYASRGWVFVSVDYRTTEELGEIEGMTQAEAVDYYKGIAPPEWVDHLVTVAGTVGEDGTRVPAGSPEGVQQGTAMYAAQRDAKAALRWIVANASTYNIDTDFITVGGNSAGAVTAVALGISDQQDFRDEIPLADDPTLSTTNLDESYVVSSMVYLWGSNAKLELLDSVYELYRYDSDDPELFMAHGTAEIDTPTPYTEAEELQGIYDSLGIHNELVPLVDWGHGAWDARVDDMSLSELSFDFIVESQGLQVE